MDGDGIPSSPNEVSGWVGGSVVQARSIDGGVHFHTKAAPPPPTGPPRQLPSASMLFMSRDDDFRWLTGQWRDVAAHGTGALLVLSGTGGVGKSALALEWLHNHAEEFPDGQLYADLGSYSSAGRVEPADVLAEFLRALGVAPEWIPAGLAQRAAALRTATHGRRIGVMLDNAFTAAQVRTLALTSAGCATVVTTREMLTGLAMDGGRTRRLDPWPPESGVAFIRRVLGGQRVDQEPQAAARVAELCGGLPLALAVAAARLTARPRRTITRLAEDLAHDGQRLEILDVGEDSAVAPVLDGSYRVLTPDGAQLYRALGACPVAWFDLPMVGALLGCGIRQAEARLDVLVDANLLEDLGERYRFHDLVRLHAERCAAAQNPPQDGAEALGRLCDFVLHSATRAEELLTPSHRLLARTYRFPPPPEPPFDDPSALAWLDEQRQNLMTLLRQCARRGRHTLTWQLADAMWPLFLRRGHIRDRIDAYTLAVAAAEADSDEAARASTLSQLASAFEDAGQLSEAAEYCSRALAVYERLGNERGTAQAMNGLAKVYMKQNELEQAEIMFDRALRLRHKIGYLRGMYLSYQGLGRVAALRGDSAAAAGHLRRSFHGLITLGDRYDAAWSLAWWARPTALLGRPGPALRRLDRAEALMAAAGSPRGQGGVLEIAGQVLAELGEPAAARAKFTAAADLFATADPKAEARVRGLAAELA